MQRRPGKPPLESARLLRSSPLSPPRTTKIQRQMQDKRLNPNWNDGGNDGGDDASRRMNSFRYFSTRRSRLSSGAHLKIREDDTRVTVAGRLFRFARRGIHRVDAST